MINPQELRLGNLFILPNGDYGKISYHEIRLLVVSTSKPNYQPVKITQDIISKSGFDDHNKLGDCIIGYYGDDFIKDVYSFMYKRSLIVKVQYLHQLQNLYFALTGKELEVNL